VVHRNFVFAVPSSVDPVIAYIKVESKGPIQIPINVMKTSEFLANEQLAYGWQAMFFGIIVALSLYNLFLFFIVRELTYLWYVLAIMTMGLSQLHLHGVLFQWYWPGTPGINRYFTVMIFGLAIIAAVMFAIRFLDVHSHSSVGYRLLRLLMFCSGFSIVYGFFGSYQASIMLVSVLAAISALGLWLLGLYIWWRGQKLAVFYVLAWTPLLLGNLLLATSKLGYVPRTFFSEVGPQIGVSVEAVLLSFALAYRINQERRQRLQAQHQALVIQREANLTLEARVQERTVELQLAKDRLEAISLTDGLTQVANRRQFDERLQTEWNRSLRNNQPLSFVLLDIDHFKSVNDQFGHLVGDDCLVALSAICTNEIKRSGDLLARYGGEEFGVLLPATLESGADQVAERLRQAVEGSPIHSSTLASPISLTISAGVATMTPEQGEQPSELVRRADEALYAAKRAGRNRVRRYHEISADGT
jgi:diguanylate cyclase (GGDEF)-like protein